MDKMYEQKQIDLEQRDLSSCLEARAARPEKQGVLL